jgi:hypothetical protein
VRRRSFHKPEVLQELAVIDQVALDVIDLNIDGSVNVGRVEKVYPAKFGTADCVTLPVGMQERGIAQGCCC